MFEGVVSQVLYGLLRRYVKGIQKEQLKIGIWKEEILLENVELILEAFDYLQLPFALKNGRIGKLSIRIPWKKLGWDPIIIVIEDVYVCACPREDSEWSSDSLDKRELAGKLAKLNAIELAKFSRRVTDNQTGQSFLSYISAKILDSIQVSMRNVHIVYMDTHNGQGNFVFGLEFTSLSIQTDTQKQSFTISLMTRSRQDEVNKIIEISNVGIYCHQLEEEQDLCHVGALENDHSRDYLVNPFCVTVSVLANKAAKLDGTPQYNMTAELTALALSVDEIQLQQILNLCDYFTICALRTKYGRYRPSQSSLSKRCKGWYRMWWQYAQNSVLADVRRRLKKTSWRYLKQRLNHQLRYVKLYRMKLELLQKGQIVSEDILQELENMDRECDIDDILNYRTIAEQQLQESLVKSSIDTHSPGSPRSDEQLAGASQGWLNWLSLGMLGVGGTADSSSFAGVISEDIIKDIYEGTEFRPVSSAENCLKKENYYSLFVRLSISQIVTTVTSRRFGTKLVDTMFSGLGMECKIWDDAATILAWLDSLRVINPLNKTKILWAEKCSTGDGLGAPVVSIQVDFPKSNERSEASTRVVVQEFNAIYEPEFFVNVLYIYNVFSAFQFQHDRRQPVGRWSSGGCGMRGGDMRQLWLGGEVLSSLNRFNNLGTRLVSKLKYMSANRKKLIWDLRIYHFVIRIPSQNCERKELAMVIDAGDVFIQSKDTIDDISRTQESNSFLDHISKSLPSYFSDDLLLGIQLDELYNQFELGLTGFQVKVLLPDRHNVSSTLIKLDASIALRLCVFLDEPVLKQLEVGFIVSSIDAYLSQTMYSTIVNLPRMKETNLFKNSVFDNTKTHVPKKLALNVSVSLKLAKLGLHVDLDGNFEESSGLIVGIEDIDIRYAICELSDLSLAMKTVNVTFRYWKDKSDSHVLCLSGNLTRCPENSVETCLDLHYRTHKHDDQIHHVYRLILCDVDLHVNPSVIGQIRMFLRKLDSGPSIGSDVESTMIGQSSMKSGAANGILPMFFLSNLCGADGTVFAGVSVDHFPFLVADHSCGYNFGCLGTQNVEAQESLYSKNEHCHDTSGLNGYHASDLTSNTYGKTQRSDCSSGSSNDPKNASRTVLDLSLISVRIHFPESCGTLVTITIPESISTLTYFDASSWDLLLSANNLTLASPWTPPNVNELVWGTASHRNASVLNVRVKKDLPALSTEVCVGIQNVCCVLPSKLLAMFVGFFLLDDWNRIAEQEFLVADNNLEGLRESHDCVTYKFDISDCVVFFPVEEQGLSCLKLEVPHFFCEFIANGSSVEFAKRIPKEFFSSECIVSRRVDVICIYARNASISLLIVSDQTDFMLKLDENVPKRIHSLIEKLDADVWIQVPCKDIPYSQQPTSPTSVMSKISRCNLIAEDLYFINGMETVIGVVDQLISIGNESKMYKGNASQFLDHRSFCEGNPDPNECTNLTISIKDLMILLGQSKAKGLALERIATANMEFDVSAVLVGEKPERIDFDVVSLTLQSPGGYTLISIVSDGPLSPVFFKFTKHHTGQDEILLSVPLFEIWLYLQDWNTIINHSHSYIKTEVNSMPVEHAAALSQFPEMVSSPLIASEFGSPDDFNLVVTCETISGVLHIPIWGKEENHTSNHMGVTPASFPMEVGTHETDDIQYCEPKGCKFVTLTFDTKHFVVMSGDSCINFRCDLERLKVLLEMIQENKGTSVPFVHISKVKSSGYVRQSERNLEHLSVDLQAEYMDVSFSHQIFNFWHNMELKFPAASSASSFYSVAFKAGLRKGSLLLSDGRVSSVTVLLVPLLNMN
ncbi:pleckstrin homology (PH) domain-containing protein [Zea mays]|uniref:Pleckstrin homology (PH) domain-containing protein n=1 Tax=Zea mays TaxID=4577 RepID=A0A1D6LEC3_MAIZE|nr:pleckstrin homology (PH) domain-containing protein [Zea mays]